MDEAQGEERKPERLVNRIVHVNFAAVHTTSTVSPRASPIECFFTDTLFNRALLLHCIILLLNQNLFSHFAKRWRVS